MTHSTGHICNSAFHLFKVHEEHNLVINHELDIEVTAGILFGGADQVFAGVVVDVKMGVVAFPTLAERVVAVFE
jgi:hypothetical protein